MFQRLLAGQKRREKERDLEVEGKKELTLGQEKTGVEFDLAISTQLVGLEEEVN